MPITHVLAFDFETTGLSFAHDRVTDAAFILYNVLEPGRCWRQRCYIDGKRAMSKKACEITGITEDMFKDMPCFEDFMVALRYRLKILAESDPPDQILLVAHNAQRFDMRMMMEEFSRTRLGFVDFWHDLNVYFFMDSLPLSREIMPQLKRHTMTYMHRAFFGTSIDGAHGAMADTDALTKVLQHIDVQVWPKYMTDIEKNWIVWRQIRDSFGCGLPEPDVSAERSTKMESNEQLQVFIQDEEYEESQEHEESQEYEEEEYQVPLHFTRRKTRSMNRLTRSKARKLWNPTFYE